MLTSARAFLDQIGLWLQESTGLSEAALGRLGWSLVALLLLWLVRRVVLVVVRRRTEDVRVRYQWRKGTSYAMVVVGALVLFRVWFDGFGNLATFLGLLSAGVAIALKDPLVNLVAWLFIVGKRPFAAGDRLAIGAFSGDVIDQSLFQFTLLETGTNTGAGQSTGRIIHVPNGQVFTEPVINHTQGFPYVWNELAVLVTFESDWRRMKTKLLEIANRHDEDLSEDAARQVRLAARDYMIFYSKLTPTVYTSVKDSGIELTIRYIVEPRRRRGSEQALWEDILDLLADEPHIDLAYPTSRVFKNEIEGKVPFGLDARLGAQPPPSRVGADGDGRPPTEAGAPESGERKPA
jgi:small-conductance mechanosensitive channel